jgi:FKBP-type peptidyl-prolyl cis-trans isomerase FklB
MTLDNELDQVSYSLGLNVALNIKEQGLEGANSAAIAKAFDDVFTGGSTLLNPAEAEQILQGYFQKKQAGLHAGNKEEGEKFLAENATKEGVTVLPSGLQYSVINEGTGAKPEATSTVNTHYHGTLINGTVFDSSVERGQPISFPVNGVIAGWTEALQLMPVGSKWKLFIPFNLAYGERGAGGKIGPFAALVFEVELLGIE